MENKNDQKNELEISRHSLAHIMALAVYEIYPNAKFAIGPEIDNGFYYDIDFGEQKIGDNDLIGIEKKMKHIIKQNLKFSRSELSIDEAISKFKKSDDVYKLDILNELKAEGQKVVSFYQLGNFVDLCRGPHIESSAKIKPGSFKLDKTAGAYWRGDEKNKMLTRIYGLAFGGAEELDSYLKMIEEAKKRDHRKLGQELDLFSISEKVGPGLILWHPKLAKIREAVESFWRVFHRQRGYDAVYTPHIGRSKLWETSGHLGFFKDSMYAPMNVDGEEYFVKPMNCPFHVEIYKSRPRSWREFPLRWNELGSVYRYEKSGELSGMLRVRGFTQDDAHIICRKDQFADEYREVLKLSFDMFKIFGFTEVKGYLAVRDPKNIEKYMGDSEIWEMAEKTIKEVVADFNMPYEVEEGGAKFYGPALDIKVKDSIGREWQLTTIQLDFNLPEKFDMTYQGTEKEERPIMIHRALLGSLERFFGVLIEHYGGSFPLWLSPVQVKILSVGEKHIDYCKSLKQEFLNRDIRVEIDVNNETVSNKIRKTASEKIPYVIVVGDKEIEDNIFAVRKRGENSTNIFSPNDFYDLILKEIADKK
ncbi:threonine--tRNA ligase [Candidatus Falkowbacteria bacterium HGW-Falkowbacteria-1]|uniref:Threonine--tRNA ligase n=1 Tax=Candidatus Falkowbacteria bacterium HGW-Falkowbacteria-1 TaxID=2013768 RepID=A0A2N2E9Q3_9BACT|nr:MAG: threonine--tRNA ligase [Candidatus Falkowbacteria bacterium HGW-Falkowbacteria-1]